MTKKLRRAREILYSTTPYQLWGKGDVIEFSELCDDRLSSIYRGLDPKVYRRVSGKSNVSEIMAEYPDADDKKMNCLFVKRYNGETIRRYPWTDRITKKVSSKDAKIKNMLRHPASHQVRAFKVEAIKFFGAVCYQCGSKSDILEVDHMFPPMTNVIGSWLDERGFPETVNRGNGIAFLNECEERDWQKYHAEKCTFQLLCPQCNSKKSDNITISGMTLAALMDELFSVPKHSIYKRYE
mgnify:FL=1